MTMASTTQVKALPFTRARASDFLSLTKPRVNLLVVSTTLAGYYMAGGADGSLIALVSCVIGTAMVSGGAAALNQVYERETDAAPRGLDQTTEILAQGPHRDITRASRPRRHAC